jgi:hypothetical protein
MLPMSFWAFNLNQSPAGKAASSQSFFGSRELQRTSTQRNREFLKIRSMTVPQVGDNRLESWLHTKLSDTSYIFPLELSLQFAFLLSSCTWLYHVVPSSLRIREDLKCVQEASNGKSFNLEVAFADFLADETRTELALPPMTTEQRKEAKRHHRCKQ